MEEVFAFALAVFVFADPPPEAGVCVCFDDFDDGRLPLLFVEMGAETAVLRELLPRVRTLGASRTGATTISVRPGFTLFDVR